jgi:excisionase family DNA binding protein
MGYKFNIEDFAPVTHVAYEKPHGIMFWFDGEATVDTPFKWGLDKFGEEAEQRVRPHVSDFTILDTFRQKGSTACIRELNTRISRYLINELNRQQDTLPNRVLTLYIDTIETFYEWFWVREQEGKKSVPPFLKKFHVDKPGQNNRVWHNVDQAAQYLGCSTSLIRKAIREGNLKASRHDPSSEKSSYSIHRKNLDGYMLFHRKKLTRPQMEELDWLNS